MHAETVAGMVQWQRRVAFADRNGEWAVRLMRKRDVVLGGRDLRGVLEQRVLLGFYTPVFFWM